MAKSHLKGFGPFKVKLAECLDRQAILDLATIWGFPRLFKDTLRTAKGDSGRLMVDEMEKRGQISPDDISSLTQALRQCGTDGIAREVERLYEENMPVETKVKKGFGTFKVELARQLNDKVIQRLSTLWSYPGSVIEHLQTAKEDSGRVMVDEMEERGQIAPGDISALTEALRQCGIHGIARDVERISEKNMSVGKPAEPFNPATNARSEDAAPIAATISQFESQKEEVQNWRDVGPGPCTLVGTVSLYTDRLLNVFDRRRNNEGVVLVCINSADASDEHWRRMVKVDDLTSPVVMSYTNMRFDLRRRSVLAAGRIVYIVLPHWTGSVNDKVESVNTLEIDDVPAGSWITAISASDKPGGNPYKEFLIAISGSSVLREYGATGSHLRSIETGEYGPSNGITSVGYNDSTIAIIGCDDVILLSANGDTVQQCGSLKPPSAGLLPVIVFWTGVHWLVLFITDGAERQWKVECHQGKHVKVCAEGTAGNDLEVPVSITRWKHTGYVIFANNKIRSFSTE